MQSLTLPRSRGKPMCGHRLSTAKTPTMVWKMAITCPSSVTVRQPISGSSLRENARTKRASGAGSRSIASPSGVNLICKVLALLTKSSHVFAYRRALRYDRRMTDEVKAQEGVLYQLKTRGPQTAAQVAKRLGVTPMAVRQHLYRLAAAGEVAFSDERRQVGRPARVWRLTEAAASRFPNSHGDLTI